MLENEVARCTKANLWHCSNLKLNIKLKLPHHAIILIRQTLLSPLLGLVSGKGGWVNVP